MKITTLVSPLILALASATALADSGTELTSLDLFQRGNPDAYDGHIPGYVSSEPVSAPKVTSLEMFQRGNPDTYAGHIPGYVPFYADSGPTITSLDLFNAGNPDYGHPVDTSLPMVSSAEAIAVAEQRRASRSKATAATDSAGGSNQDDV